ncbi:hypothetical protein FO519_003026 [Halicephalobus sp. NKZ332]|nr:hypothetical protein FO519_003026 [Halicephalobus sp. NKZ332]
MTSPSPSSPSFSDYLDQAKSYLDNLSPLGKAAVAGGAGFVIYMHYKWLSTRPRRTPYVQPFAKDLVYLCQFPRSSAVPNLSPFCLKLETWLRIADIPYRNVENFPITYRSREGTLPFVELNGIEYPDSGLAIKDLSLILKKESLEVHLNDEQRAVARSFEVLIEGNLWPMFLKFREQHVDELLALQPPSLFGPLTKFMNFFARHLITTNTENKLFYSGIGKHSEQDLIRLSEEDLLAISKFLGTKHYLTGFKATKVDAAVFGVLAQIIYLPFETPQKKYISQKCPNLKDYCERIKNRYWPDWEEATKRFSMKSDWKKKTPNPSPHLTPNGRSLS